MSIKDRLCPQVILIFRAQIEPEEILVGFQWLDFWPWNDCKTVYPGSIPGVASTHKIFSFSFHQLLPVLSSRA
jgi:hypothetical protein